MALAWHLFLIGRCKVITRVGIIGHQRRIIRGTCQRRRRGGRGRGKKAEVERKKNIEEQRGGKELPFQQYIPAKHGSQRNDIPRDL